jgi:polar amino acid transport system substrate-binding protein
MRKVLLLVGVLLLVPVLLVGCQRAQVEESASSTYDSVMSAGVVRAGVRFDNPPMSYIDEDGRWIGFDVELAEAVGRQLGVEVELVRVDGTTRISFLQEGRIDMSVASMNITRSRHDAIDFSVPYFWDNQSFLIRKGTYGAIDELMGKRVAVNAGSSTIPSWTAYSAANGGPPPAFVEFTGDKVAAMQALRDGAVEGYTEDNITMLVLAAGIDDLELLPGGHNPVRFGIGLPQNDTVWRNKVNYALQDLWADGTWQAIYDKWFGPTGSLPRASVGGAMDVWPP